LVAAINAIMSSAFRLAKNGILASEIDMRTNQVGLTMAGTKSEVIAE
jgi:hypothetical protein